jgi:hypothetical protein
MSVRNTCTATRAYNIHTALPMNLNFPQQTQYILMLHLLRAIELPPWESKIQNDFTSFYAISGTEISALATLRFLTARLTLITFGALALMKACHVSELRSSQSV